MEPIESKIILESGSDLIFFKSSASKKEFDKKWNLDIYFRLRFQEIAIKFESFLGEKAAKLTSDSNPEFSFAVNQALWRSLQTCFGLEGSYSRNIYLRPCAHNFLKLSMQLLSRYDKWIQAKANDFIAKLSLEEIILFYSDVFKLKDKVC